MRKYNLWENRRMRRLVNHMKEKWNLYKYRFVPWIATNLRNRSIRSVAEQSDKLIDDDAIEDSLINFFSLMDKADKRSIEDYYKTDPSNTHDLIERHEENMEIMNSALGFSIKRSQSTVIPEQKGVVVSEGFIPKGSVVSCYPGAIYFPQEPILIQSIGNSFVFRCVDGLLIDGNDKGISRSVYKSCWRRDRIGPLFACDSSWLTPYPVNPMAVGQYVNNHNKEYPANVAYQEFDLSQNFPVKLRQYIPNVFFSSTSLSIVERPVRMVLLISTRDIKQGEELLSSYFTLVHQ